ncbi:hypothetical protein QNH10_18290 [Sporosarcina thermotolerans]|uniref:hypothetical protein n=1 Tax=Sporosarcina thermotolerans TaxID=633404 RepID=UPI0024BC4C39|nr:hypothetical protein [Sporosarcina thermotolerans]WHT50006.1 hypothetical protein QNH10_18290 [Sporosarcina thermotolerans]
MHSADFVPHFFKGAYGGDVLIGDMDILSHEISDIAAKVGLVFENPFSQMTGAKFTVYDEIAFGLENYGVPRDEMRKRIEKTMQLLDIDHLQNKNPFSLWGDKCNGWRLQVSLPCIQIFSSLTNRLHN